MDVSKQVALTPARRISVVMASYNRRDKTVQAIKNIYGQDRKNIEIKVHLLDDASGDGTANTIANFFPDVEIIHGDGQRFWGGGMFAAMLSATAHAYDFILWLNDDVVLVPGAISSLLETYDRVVLMEGDKRQIVVGSLINPLTGTVAYTGMQRTSGWHPARLRPILPDATIPLPCDTMNGNCVLIPRDVVERIGFIDPHFVQQLGDIDYGYRARRAGVQLWIAPQPVGTCIYEARAKTWQTPGLTLAQRWRKLNSPHGWPVRSWMRFMWRHGGSIAVAAMVGTYIKTLAQSKRA